MTQLPLCRTQDCRASSSAKLPDNHRIEGPLQEEGRVCVDLPVPRRRSSVYTSGGHGIDPQSPHGLMLAPNNCNVHCVSQKLSRGHWSSGALESGSQNSDGGGRTPHEQTRNHQGRQPSMFRGDRRVKEARTGVNVGRPAVQPLLWVAEVVVFPRRAARGLQGRRNIEESRYAS